MKKTHQALILIAVYALTLGVRVYWLSQKDGLHVDEGLTIAITSYNDFIAAENYELNKKYTGKELKAESLASDASLKGALADIHNLWKDNRDPPHTNLYYTFLRLSLIGLKSGDIAPIVLRGGILNILFFTASFIFFFMLMRLLFPRNKLLQFAAVFCAFMSTAGISNALFLRPYQIQEMLFIMFVFYFVSSLSWNKNIIYEKKIQLNTIKKIIFMSLLTALTLMTGYYAVFFIGLFGLYAIYYLCRKKSFAEIPFYFVILGLGILFARILYPKYISGFFSYRGQEALKTLSANAAENIKVSIINAGTLLQKHFFTLPVIVLCVFCLVCIIIILIRKLKIENSSSIEIIVYESDDQKTAWYIFAASIIYLIVIMIAAPYKVLRYIMPVFPFLIILPIILISSIEARSRKIAACAVLLFCGSFAFNSLQENKIENIFRGKQNEYVFTQNKDTPVYIITFPWSIWKYANLIPYLNDEQAYYFINMPYQPPFDINLPEAEDYDSVYVLIEYEPEAPQLYDAVSGSLHILGLPYQGIVESEFDINTGEPESWYPYFKGRKIILDDSVSQH